MRRRAGLTPVRGAAGSRVAGAECASGGGVWGAGVRLVGWPEPIARAVRVDLATGTYEVAGLGG